MQDIYMRKKEIYNSNMYANDDEREARGYHISLVWGGNNTHPCLKVTSLEGRAYIMTSRAIRIGLPVFK